MPVVLLLLAFIGSTLFSYSSHSKSKDPTMSSPTVFGGQEMTQKGERCRHRRRFITRTRMFSGFSSIGLLLILWLQQLIISYPSVVALTPIQAMTSSVLADADKRKLLVWYGRGGASGGGSSSRSSNTSSSSNRDALPPAAVATLLASTTQPASSTSSKAMSTASSTNENTATAGTATTLSSSSSMVAAAAAAGDDAKEQEEHPPKPEDPRTMFLIRLLFLSYYASLGALMPYLPVYYHSLGHGGQIIGMLGAVKPLTTFLVAPFWGLVADQTQAPFTILKVTFLVSLVGQLMVAGYQDYRYIMFMVFITALFNAPVKSLIDSMVMSHINDRSQYGRLRLWGQMGFGFGSSGVGILLSHSKGVISPTATSIPDAWLESISKFPGTVQKFIHLADSFWQAITGYRLLFLTHAALSVPTWMAIQAFQRLDNESKEPQKKRIVIKKPKETKESSAHINDGLSLLVHNTDALLFFFLIFVVGVSSGVVENFAYVRLREVGGTGREMGFSRLVSSIAGAPMFWFSGPLTEKLGADRVLVLSLCSYALRFLIYAFMQKPLQGLPAEALRGITFAAFWSTGTIYAHRISPPGLHATMVNRVKFVDDVFYLVTSLDWFYAQKHNFLKVI